MTGCTTVAKRRTSPRVECINRLLLINVVTTKVSVATSAILTDN